MFKKILIANRGEIACRIIKTAKRMGIKTVAIFSEADSRSLHVDMADESVHIGPSSIDKSYLNIKNIMVAVNKTGADAVHPGYGFLSENFSFAKAIRNSNVEFIGPSPKSIAAMGDKIQSKKIAVKAGMNTIPGYGGAVDGLPEAIKEAKKIGYPVMLKASAGGGGKGMRIANNEDECRSALSLARGEASNAFGDDRVFVEKYIKHPRHIEIQVLADKKGNAVFLHERECSIQRRHQKIIEEAPSSFLDKETRLAMGKQAIALSKAVNYYSAGTVEFIVDKNRNFYFLEMNTRLQVEHPVTEKITGIDLVEWMIRIAAGEILSFSQNEVPLNGWSIETRIYAENPSKSFMPSSGRLKIFKPPKEKQSIRIDTGVFEGGEVPIHFDPMIAKLISHGSTRNEAINLMSEALDEFLLKGVSHNMTFLSAIMSNSHFIDGNINTDFISDEFPMGFQENNLSIPDLDLMICVVASIHHAYHVRDLMISDQFLVQKEDKKLFDWLVKIDNSKYSARVSIIDNGYHISIDKKEFFLESNWKLGEALFKGKFDGNLFCMQLERLGIKYYLTHRGAVKEIIVLSPKVAMHYIETPKKTITEKSKYLLSPMPGILISLSVTEGETFHSGDELAIVEAMKMENVLRAEFDGIVSSISASIGDVLSVDQVILEFKKENN
jgi:propionyl-CoA carboxylase alpha chain